MKRTKGLLIPVWPRLSQRELRPETRSFLEVAVCWRSGCEIRDHGRLLHVGGIDRVLAMRGGFVHRGRPLGSDMLTNPDHHKEILQAVPDGDLSEMRKRGRTKGARALIDAEIARRKRRGTRKPRPDDANEDLQTRMWRLWLRAGHGAPALCWWTWQATATLLGASTLTSPNTIAKMGQRVGLRKMLHPVICGCVRNGDHWELTARLSLGRRRNDPEEVSFQVPVSAYR